MLLQLYYKPVSLKKKTCSIAYGYVIERRQSHLFISFFNFDMNKQNNLPNNKCYIKL